MPSTVAMITDCKWLANGCTKEAKEFSIAHRFTEISLEVTKSGYWTHWNLETSAIWQKSWQLCLQVARKYKPSKDIWCYIADTETKANEQSPSQRNNTRSLPASSSQLASDDTGYAGDGCGSLIKDLYIICARVDIFLSNTMNPTRENPTNMYAQRGQHRRIDIFAARWQQDQHYPSGGVLHPEDVAVVRSVCDDLG